MVVVIAFSALGTAAVLWTRRKRNPRSVPQATSAAIGRSHASERVPTLPSGNEIAIAISDAPPFQRKKISANYVGLVVSWPIIFVRLARLNAQRCIVTLAYGGETWGAKVDVIVGIAKYPRLKTAHEPSDRETNLIHGWIEGKIVKCGLCSMEVEPTKLEFFN
jgi:hypothetical protein